MRMRLLISVLTACLLLAACGGDSEWAGKKKSPAATPTKVVEILGVPAVKTSRLELAACFAEDIADEASASSRCPSFVLLPLDYLTQECALAAGTLRPVEQPIAWSLDVDGDASAEILVDLRQNMDCLGAPGVFSCGSLGCPYFLYAKRDDSWVELGAISADDAPAIEVLPGPPGTPATLRGGCNGLQPCSEKTYYEWNGKSYERSWIDFRGYVVDVAPGGLSALTRDAPILASPESDGQVLDTYPIDTAVVVIGNARGTPYKFVSPCNGCRRGFVDETALKN
jgi:hypothetical protein